MKLNKHTYIDIVEKNVETQYTLESDSHYHYHTVLAYKVNIITEYDIKLFGKIFRKSKTKELPFLFRTLEMAKEFCEINPKYEKVCFQNSKEIDSSVKFYTYQLIVNKEIVGYIWWNDETVYLNGDWHMEFKFNNKSIIDGFVKNIDVQSWSNTFHQSDIKYYGFTVKLTNLVKPINNDNGKHWRFELIENK